MGRPFRAPTDPIPVAGPIVNMKPTESSEPDDDEPELDLDDGDEDGDDEGDEDGDGEGDEEVDAVIGEPIGDDAADGDFDAQDDA